MLENKLSGTLLAVAGVRVSLAKYVLRAALCC